MTEEKKARWQSKIRARTCYAFGYGDGGRDHEPREAGRKTLETGEDKERNPPVKLSKGTGPAYTSLSVRCSCFWISVFPKLGE